MDLDHRRAAAAHFEADAAGNLIIREKLHEHCPLRQPAAKPDRIDPITTSVIQGALENIAVEMGYKLMRMSYSSIIRESEDFGAALVDAEGRGLAESAQSTPLQSGPIPGYVRGVLRKLAERGDQFRPGDVIMHNDAYSGASHGPDVAFIVPVFVQGKLIGFAATTAHHLDIGALSPGSCGIVEAIDAYAEGLQFKAIKVYDRGVKNDMVWQIVRDNIRASDLVVGDMDAQVAAARIGAERMAELVERYGLDDLRPRLHRADGPCRAADAPGHRQAARRRLSRRDGHRRLSRQRRSARRRNCRSSSPSPRRTTASWSTSPAPRRRCPTGRSTCRSKARPTSRSGSPSARCCSTPKCTATSRSMPGSSGRSPSSRPRAASPTRPSPRRPSPASARAISSPTR